MSLVMCPAAQKLDCDMLQIKVIQIGTSKLNILIFSLFSLNFVNVGRKTDGKT